MNQSIRRLSASARINKATLFFWYPCGPACIMRDRGRIKIMTAVAVGNPIGSPQPGSEFRDARKSVFCYKDFSAGIVKQSGAIAGCDRIQLG